MSISLSLEEETETFRKNHPSQKTEVDSEGRFVYYQTDSVYLLKVDLSNLELDLTDSIGGYSPSKQEDIDLSRIEGRKGDEEPVSAILKYMEIAGNLNFSIKIKTETKSYTLNGAMTTDEFCETFGAHIKR